MTRIGRSSLPDIPGGIRHQPSRVPGDWCGGDVPEPGWCGDVKPPQDSCETLPAAPGSPAALLAVLLRRLSR